MNWSKFFLTLASIAPAIVVGSMALAKEAGSADKTTTASDALHLATGVTEALASDDPKIVSAAKTASSIIGSVITAIQTHGTSVPVVQ